MGLADVAFARPGGAEVDGTPIRNWKIGVNSFVFADLSWGLKTFLQAFDKAPVRGHRILHQSQVHKEELVKPGYSMQAPVALNKYAFFYASQRNWLIQEWPFAMWTIFEKDADQSEAHVPERFSFLELSAEVIVNYDGFYVAFNCAPHTLAFTRPSLTFGSKYSDFERTLLQWMIRSKLRLSKHLFWNHRYSKDLLSTTPWGVYHGKRIHRPWPKDGGSRFCVSLWVGDHEVL